MPAGQRMLAPEAQQVAARILAPAGSRGLGRAPRVVAPPTAGLLTLPARQQQQAHRLQGRSSQGCRHPACSAATLDKAALSQYAWPAARPQVLTWLEECVHDAVKHLDQAPFLQLVSGHARSIQRHPVAEAIMQAPQLWQGIAQHLSQTNPEVIVLVHQLPRAAVEDGSACFKSAGGWSPPPDEQRMFTGMAAHAALDQGCLKRSTAALEAPGGFGSSAARSILSGRVGEDCCDDEDEDAAAADVNPALSFDGSVDPQLTDYWGLVVQSRSRSEAEGCYVLKTVRSVDTGPGSCQCTAYSLTRVCKGQPLQAQLASAWLVQ